MKTTHALSHVLDYDLTEKTLLEDIKHWIDSNMLMMDQKYIWKVGITTGEDIVKIAGKVRSDFECKHFKYWRADNFKDALGTLTRLTKYPFIFKSNLNGYTGKGAYIFAYKAPCPSKNLFYHTLHY
ncbi:hypothetical protein [Roseivirga sp.]|uniref:hypothetical protein n=1 Tax=Roseivirga sp. TaxID=1964215 RepID=UPI003B52D345